jgi:hypothetical protein
VTAIVFENFDQPNQTSDALGIHSADAWQVYANGTKAIQQGQFAHGATLPTFGRAAAFPYSSE